ncbi:MAG: hypothetical protein H0V09_08045 [Gemmatimonadetes bacterium]|nr:hypothetical protein [Gemmatimonadota bacterium]
MDESRDKDRGSEKSEHGENDHQAKNDQQGENEQRGENDQQGEKGSGGPGPGAHDVLDLINDYRIGGLEQVLIGLDVVSARNARAEQILYARRNARSDLRERYGDTLSERQIEKLAELIEEEIRRRRPD